MRAAEIAFDVLFGVAALLRADDHHALFAELGEAGHDCVVVLKQAVAVQFGKAIERALNVIERIGPLRVARELHALPRGEVGVELLFLGRNFFLELADLVIDIHAVVFLLRLIAQTLQFLLEVEIRFLEIEQVLHSEKRLTGRRAIRKTLLTKAITVGKPAPQ